MYLNDKYNMGLLILFHLLIVAIIKIFGFIYIVKPAIQQQIKNLNNSLPKLNENTLNKLGIKHDKALTGSISSVFQIIMESNKKLGSLFDVLNEMYITEVSTKLQNYLRNKQMEDELKTDQKNQKFYFKSFVFITAFIGAIFTWYVIHMNYKKVKTNLPELILGNIIPITIISVFEYYFLTQVVLKYKITGKYGLLYEILNKLYYKN
jgi:hypothetical protein